MELFAKLFDSLLVFVYHCFDRIVVDGYLGGLSRPEQSSVSSAKSWTCPLVSKRCAEPAHRRLPQLGLSLRPQS
jgi:hypothetical protein